MILRHVVMMKMSANSREERDERAARLTAELEALEPQVEQILALSVGVNTLESPGNWDLALTVDVEDEAALETYRQHPEHIKVAAIIQELVADRCAVDYLV